MEMPHWPALIGYRDIELGLSRITQLLSRLGNPQEKLPPVIHVAGTNGKGSTIAFMRAILESAGYKVHVYTSPHLVEFNERYVVAGQIVSDKALNEILDECKAACGDDLRVTFFEGVTVAAFALFAKYEADIVLLETGLGGRLDASNVITKPVATTITSISMDHMDFLGGKLEGIAGEKAGIMKNNSPCISVIQSPVVEAVLRNYSEEIGCSIEFVKVRRNLGDIALKGQHQRLNASLAIRTLEKLPDFNISSADAAYGISHAHWNARMQKLETGQLVALLNDGDELWLDGGHNEAAGQAIANVVTEISEENQAFYVICAMLDNKDSFNFLNKLHPVVKKFYAVAIPNEEKSMQAEDLMEQANFVGFDAHHADSVEGAIRAIKSGDNGNLRIIICGSLYLAGTVLASKD